MEGFHHRSLFKVPHKSYKGKSKAKAQRNKAGKKVKSSQKGSKEQGRKNRQNAAKQLQNQKRSEVLAKKRLGSRSGPAKIVGVIALNDESTDELIKLIHTQAARFVETSNSNLSHFVTTIDKKEQKFLLYKAPRDIVSVLNICKVADVLLLVTSPTSDLEHGVDELGQHFITLLNAQGPPSILGVIQNLESIPTPKRNAAKKACVDYFQDQFKTKALPLASQQDALTLFRQIANQKLREVHWREQRSYLLGEHVSFTSVGDAKDGNLTIRGFLRGSKMLSANHLVHITGYGDYQVEKIEEVLVTAPESKRKASKAGDASMEDAKSESDGKPTSVLLDQADEKQESLEDLRSLDPLSTTADQSVITEEEIKAVEDAEKKKKSKKKEKKEKKENKPEKAPEGMSDYQSLWDKLDADEALDGEDDDDEGDGEEKELNLDMEEDEEFGGLDVDALEKRDSSQDISKLRKLEADEMEWPDEVEVPRETILNERFRLYRGLKSFRHSPWDVKESLPQEYGQIYQFHDFRQTRKRVLKEHAAPGFSHLGSLASPFSVASSTTASPALPSQSTPKSTPPTLALDSSSMSLDGIQDIKPLDEKSTQQKRGVIPNTGRMLAITLKNFSTQTAKEILSAPHPILLWGLLEYEHKVSVLHAVIRRQQEYDQPIKAKDPLTFEVGFRRFVTQPIFTQHVKGVDKHLCDRFFHQGRWTVASFYARIMFPQAPVLVFTPTLKEGKTKSGDELDVEPTRPQFVAHGTLMSVDPDRMLIKRIILTGYPVQVRNRFAIVRYMFFNPDDVRWFKTVQIWTKRGAKGQIKEPRGTKGYMKCVFDNPIKQNDTVCMSLYKRQFPPWKLSLIRQQ